MRILVLPLDFPSVQGPYHGIFVLRQMEALRELGHELSVLRLIPAAPPVTPKLRFYASLNRRDVEAGFPVRTERSLVLPRMLSLSVTPWLFKQQIARAIANFKPDILHAHFIFPPGFIAVRQSVPAVITAHGSDAYAWPWRRRDLRWIATDAVKRAAAVVATSDFVRRHVRKLGRLGDVDVVHNGANQAVFFPGDSSAARTRLGLPLDRFTVAFAGNLLRAKGIYDLVDAAAQLRDIRPLLVYAGAGPEHAGIISYASERDVDLRLLGRLDHASIADLFRASDIVSLPSHNEGLPTVLCEAMLSGSAIVATSVGGIPEIIRNGDTGFICEPRNAAQLSEAIRRFASSPSLRANLGANALAFASEQLTWRANALQYERVYRRVLTT